MNNQITKTIVTGSLQTGGAAKVMMELANENIEVISFNAFRIMGKDAFNKAIKLLKTNNVDYMVTN